MGNKHYLSRGKSYDLGYPFEYINFGNVYDHFLVLGLGKTEITTRYFQLRKEEN